MFAPGDGLVGIDLDHCGDPITEMIDAWGVAYIDEFSSYTEVSPSRTGIHIPLRGLMSKGTK